MRLTLNLIILLFSIFGLASPLTEQSLKILNATQGDWIQRIVVVAPVYRELKSGNLVRFLKSIANQETAPQHPLKWDVVLLLNDHPNASEEALEENRLTLEVLKELQSRKLQALSKVPEEQQSDWKALFSSGFQLHVLDRLGREFAVKPIGEKRDIATQYALNLLKDEELRSSAISQVDSDCHYQENFGTVVQAYFKNRALDFLLMDITFDVERDSPSQQFGAWAYDELTINEDQTLAAYNDVLPRNSMPRIVTRASTAKSMGQIPHKAYAEDCAYIRALKERYKGSHVFESQVFVSHRSRLDGFDSERIHQGMSLAKAITQKQYNLANAIIRYEQQLRSSHIWGLQMMEKEYQHIMSHRKASIEKKRSILIDLVTQLAHRPESISPATGVALFDSAWFKRYLRTELSQTNRNIDKVVFHAIEDYPHELDASGTNETEMSARFTAFRRWLLFSKIWKQHANCARSVTTFE